MDRSYENRFEDRIETDQDLSLTFARRASGSILIFLHGEKDRVRLDLHADEYSYVKIFVYNQMDRKIHFEISARLEQDAKIELGVLDLQSESLDLVIDGHLDKPGASMDLYTAQLCLEGPVKKGKIDLTSHAEHTYGTMHNFAVCFERGQYEMAAAGRIVKGAFGSESHQETRVLTMGENHRALVLPILYIDENEVKASHALTIGQPDDSQLYYLQSRGLNTRQAMGLLSVGYFKPVLSLIDDEALRDELSRKVEQRVGLYEY